MKNTLEIKNFLIIDSVELEIKKFTVFIGPQASGKSIVAKLLYIFYHFPEIVFDIAMNGGKKRKLNEAMVKIFCEIFPQYAWSDKAFSICFKTEVGDILFSHSPGKALTFSVSDYYERILRKIFLFTAKSSDLGKMEKEVLEHVRKVNDLIHNSEWGFINGGGSSTFIPAGRSFFACLENNVFSFLSNNIHIDYFLKEFGMIYQRSRNLLLMRIPRKNSESIMNSFSDVCKKYISGTYLQKQQKDYIKNTKNGLEIEVREASSGQQELLPILFAIFREQEKLFLIEEPETHIFPSSQSEIIKYIVSTQDPNSCRKSFLFTTHSPYVLTTLNNLTYAGILESRFINENRNDMLEKLDKIYPKQERIQKDNLSAYYFCEGNVKSIVDSETGMIDAEKLDEISNVTNEKFSNLVNLEIQSDVAATEEN